MATFLHGKCFSLVKLTLIKYVRSGNFTTWSGLTAKLIAKHTAKSKATVFGNLEQTRKTPDQQKVENLSLEMEIYIFLTIEETTTTVLANKGLK